MMVLVAPLTYRHSFIKSRALTLAAGLSAQLRSADIALMSDSAYARHSDLGGADGGGNVHTFALFH